MPVDRRTFLGAATAGMTGLAGCLGRAEYRIDETNVGETNGPLALDVVAEDPGVTVDSPGVLACTLHNESSRSVEIRNTDVWPFGVLQLAPSLDAEGRAGIRLGSDAYVDSDYVDTSGRTFGVEGEPLVEPLAAGDSVGERYVLHGDRGVQPGTHFLRAGFGSTPLDGDGEPLPPLLWYRAEDGASWTRYFPEVRVTLSELSLLP